MHGTIQSIITMIHIHFRIRMQILFLLLPILVLHAIYGMRNNIGTSTTCNSGTAGTESSNSMACPQSLFQSGYDECVVEGCDGTTGKREERRTCTHRENNTNKWD